MIYGHGNLLLSGAREQLCDCVQVLLCADLWKDRDTLHAAYCDREGVTEAFIKNGIAHAFGSLGADCAVAADPDNWNYEVHTHGALPIPCMPYHLCYASLPLAVQMPSALQLLVLAVLISRPDSPINFLGLLDNLQCVFAFCSRRKTFAILLLLKASSGLITV